MRFKRVHTIGQTVLTDDGGGGAAEREREEKGEKWAHPHATTTIDYFISNSKFRLFSLSFPNLLIHIANTE